MRAFPTEKKVCKISFLAREVSSMVQTTTKSSLDHLARARVTSKTRLKWQKKSGNLGFVITFQVDYALGIGRRKISAAIERKRVASETFGSFATSPLGFEN